jgi:hypothetical protein
VPKELIFIVHKYNMEVKKSAQADLERRKPTGFLLGLIVALSLLLVALEFSSNPSDEGTGDNEFDEMAQDYEMMPPEEQQEYNADRKSVV